MVLFLVQSNKLWHVIPQLALIKLYCQSLSPRPPSCADFLAVNSVLVSRASLPLPLEPYQNPLSSVNSRKILSEHGNGTSHALALKSLDPALPRHRDNRVIHVTME